MSSAVRPGRTARLSQGRWAVLLPAARTYHPRAQSKMTISSLPRYPAQWEMDAVLAGNPVDLGAGAGAQSYREAIVAVTRSGEVDAILAIHAPVATVERASVAEAIAGAATGQLPVLATFLATHEAPVPQAEGRTVPSFQFVEPAAQALSAVCTYADWRKRPHGTVPSRQVTSADAAARALAELGGPVALKVVSPDIVHRTDAGGVQLGLRSAAEVRDAYTTMAGALGERMSGAVVQRMAQPGVELIVGLVQDLSSVP